MADLSGPVDLLHVPDDDCGASSEDVNSQQPQGSPGHVLGVLQENIIIIIVIIVIITIISISIIITCALPVPNRNGGWTTNTIPEMVSTRFTG